LGGLILYCDFLCDNHASNIEATTWLVINHASDVVAATGAAAENPVQEFVMALHRSPASSGLLFQASFGASAVMLHEKNEGVRFNLSAFLFRLRPMPKADGKYNFSFSRFVLLGRCVQVRVCVERRRRPTPRHS
jgi:hypothetical protein